MVVQCTKERADASSLPLHDPRLFQTKPGCRGPRKVTQYQKDDEAVRTAFQNRENRKNEPPQGTSMASRKVCRHLSNTFKTRLRDEPS